MATPPRHISCAFLCTAVFFLTSCWGYYTGNNPNTEPVIQPEAYVPVYGLDSTRNIYSLPPQPIGVAGKIYVLGNYLFQVEKKKGVHIIDYTDRKAPVKLAFIKSMGATELAVKNGYLITNNLDDLVSIDISNPVHAREVARIPHAFKDYLWQYYLDVRPPEKGKYYVCPGYNSGKGEVIGWKLEKNVKGASCFNY